MDRWNINITLNTLLCESVQLSEDHNSDLFKMVQQYIKLVDSSEYLLKHNIYMRI